jgi:hypothetical protein
MRFDYRVEPVRQALLLAGVFLFVALLVREPLIQIVLLAVAAGPAAWAAIQWIRRGRGVQVCDDHLLVENPLLRRARHIPYRAVRGYSVTGAGGLAVAYEKAAQPATAATNRTPALTSLRPESHTLRPRYTLVVTSPLVHADNLSAALTERLGNTAARSITGDDVLAWARRRRVRNLLLIVLAVLGTPLYVIVIGRIIAGFISFGAVNVTR